MGGGSVANNTPHDLARIPLRWMIRQCFLANTGIRFHTKLLRKVGIDPHSLYPIVQKRPRALYTSDLVFPGEGPQIPPLQLKADESTPLMVAPAIHNRTESSATAVDELTLERLRDSKLGTLSEEEEDLADALCPIYDQLSLAKGWWILELLPMKQRFQNPQDNSWEEEIM